jgi:hypothetical protein
MTKNDKPRRSNRVRKAVRARMAEKGIKYTKALREIEAEMDIAKENK